VKKKLPTREHRNHIPSSPVPRRAPYARLTVLRLEERQRPTSCCVGDMVYASMCGVAVNQVIGASAWIAGLG